MSTPTIVATKASKRALRKKVATALQSLSVSALEVESAKVVAQALTASWYTQARSIGIYLSMPTGEVQTRALVEHALSSGKQVYIPHCEVNDKSQKMRMLRLENRQHLDGLEMTKWGIPQFRAAEIPNLVDADAPLNERGGGGLDVVFVPGLAFDVSRNRLGHGRGYYDRYLNENATEYPKKFKKALPLTVALSLTEQILPPSDRVPTDEWDRKIDIILTPDGVLQ